MAKSKRRRKRAGRQEAATHAPRRQLSVEERGFERAAAEMRHRAAEAHATDTPPERIATILAEDFDDVPSPIGFAQMLADQDPERARAVAQEVQRLAPGSLVALTFAAEVARKVDADPKRSQVLLEEAIESHVDPITAAQMGVHLLDGGMVLEALDAAGECLGEDPGDQTGQEVRAAALGQLHCRARSGERLGRPERQALDRFADRGLLYRLRDRIGAFVEQRPELQELVADTVREWLAELDEDEPDWLGELGEGGSVAFDGRHEALFGLAIERALLREQEDEIEDEDGELLFEPEPELEDSSTPLALLARDPSTPAEISLAAQRWLETCTYGLWQVSDPSPAPGVWLTDIVSGVRRYAAIAPEQLEQASPWTVWLGAVVCIDGTWRTTRTLVPMRPAEGDSAAEFVREATNDIVRALAGKRPRRGAGRGKDPQPHGVLAEASEPAEPMLADLISKVIGSLAPVIASELWRGRAAGPALANTDGHRLKFITALVRVTDRQTAMERLTAHPDFRMEDGELTWWGRELTELEQQSTLAELRAQFGDDVDGPEETPRWLRGRVKAHNGGFEVEVNSEERLAMLLAVLGELGLEPQLTRRSAMDPTQDRPPIPLGGATPFGTSQEGIDTWLGHWPDERVPALVGLTPRVAAKRRDKRPYLEAVLREFEHDAHQLAREGTPAPDIRLLRAELAMERWWD